jgi:hypothetical protein
LIETFSLPSHSLFVAIFAATVDGFLQCCSKLDVVIHGWRVSGDNTLCIFKAIWVILRFSLWDLTFV